MYYLMDLDGIISINEMATFQYPYFSIFISFK
mgnify:CR=1 FL=1